MARQPDFPIKLHVIHLPAPIQLIGIKGIKPVHFLTVKRDDPVICVEHYSGKILTDGGSK
jgi:hypothetical protein